MGRQECLTPTASGRLSPSFLHSSEFVHGPKDPRHGWAVARHMQESERCGLVTMGRRIQIGASYGSNLLQPLDRYPIPSAFCDQRAQLTLGPTRWHQFAKTSTATNGRAGTPLHARTGEADRGTRYHRLSGRRLESLPTLLRDPIYSV